METRVAAIDAKRRRVQAAILWTALGGVAYIVVLILVLKNVTTPLPAWVPLVWIPMPVVILGIPALRFWSRSLQIAAVRARMADTTESIDALEASQKEQRSRATERP
jgi:uncharacterized protein (DUF983 family)